MDYSTLSEEFLDSDVYRQRMKWSILTTVDSPEFQGTHSPFDAKFGDVLKNRWEDGLIQSALLLCFVIPVVHVILHRAVCTPVSKYLLGWKDPKKSDLQPAEQAELDRTLAKFEESAWKCFVYLFLSACSAYALYDKDFWYRTASFWTVCTRMPCEYEPDARMRFSYSVDLAYYVYAIPYLVFFETRRKDFSATLAHHFITIALIVYCYFLGFMKGGLVVMFLHDVCDPWLEVAKMARYCGNDAVTNVFFGLFTAVWIAMRDVYLPLFVIRSVYREAWVQMVIQGGYPPFPHYIAFLGMLLFLWSLHVYWTYIILRIAYKSVAYGKTDDDRED